MTHARFETVSIGNIHVHVCSTEKFKTTTLAALIQQELAPATVTKTALLPSVLQRGTVTYPSTLDLKRRLDEMYGATLFGDVYKRGERHIIHLGMEIANEQYLKEKKSLLKEGLEFFSEILTRPFMENGGFKDSFVQAEKKNLKQKIESLQDDKIRYAAQRMIEAMCENEPFALFNHGRLEDLPEIDAQNLYTYYREVIDTCPVDFYCVGNVHTDDVVSLLTKNLQINTAGKRKSIPVSAVTRAKNEVKEVVDRLDVKQGKLNMGCRTQITAGDPEYPALLMYNGILGGFPHSKLFINVREKASLAYYASSRIESHKGILTIQSGIEIANYDRTVEIIKQQLEAMSKGDISDRELEQTKATLSNQLREQQDRSFDLINFHYHSVLSGKERPLDQLLEMINETKREDIKRVAEMIQLDTIYFLRDQGGDTDAKN